VRLSDGTRRRMDALRVGDTVEAMDESSGELIWSPIYMFFDADATRRTIFLDIHLQEIQGSRDRRVLRVTPNHFVYATSAALMADDVSKASLLHAGAVRVGDTMWVSSESHSVAAASKVVAVEHVPGQGVFSPHTLAGSIVVDGVVAHSSGDLPLSGGRFLSSTLGIHPKVYFVSGMRLCMCVTSSKDGAGDPHGLQGGRLPC
jgi:hypothetical protein